MAESGADRERLESLFEQAESLDPAERANWLAQLGDSDPALARELASLMEFDDSAGANLRGIIDRAIADSAREQHWPRQFGPYRVLRTIAAGGMGTVFEAVREQDYHKRVALKVAASPIGTPAWVERFQQERQILAGLEHPHIARFLDGGASAEGLPYFAMELVEGEPITEFVRNRKLAIRERIELFRKVCAAVSFAHQSLVVHRDLKPANILVTAEGEPKLLDFGLAKLQSAMEPNVGLTQTALPLLTPAYCSPEQVLGGKITTRVDVYLLGLVLFDVLTGRQAHQLSGAAPAELQRAICEDPAPVPSAVTAGLAGDLDVIVVKALQKEPDRRYHSVDELNEDLGRYLDGRPILARPAAWSYRTGKFLRRNWIPVSAAAALVVALIGGAAAFFWQARIAERRFALARRLANVLIFDIHDQVQSMPGAIDLRETISARAVEYLDALSRDAGRNYALRRELAAAYARLTSARWHKDGLAPRQGSDSILAMLNRAIALLKDMPPHEMALAAPTEAQLLNRRGQLLFARPPREGAQEDFERALAISPCSSASLALCESRITALEFLNRLCLLPNDWKKMSHLRAELRSALENYGTFGNQTFYEWNTLTAGFLEMRMFETQQLYAEGAECVRRELPVAERLAGRTSLPPDALSELTRAYQCLGRLMRKSGQGSPEERIAFFQKGMEFAQARVNLDTGDSMAYFELGDSQSEIALEYQSIDPRQAAQWFRLSLESYLERPNVAVNGLEHRIALWERGRDAIRFFLRVHRQEDALWVARRICGVMSPALFLKLDLPRSEDAQRIQALWWMGTEASHENVDLAEALWTRAVRDSQEALNRTPRDAVIQASAAFAFEGWSSWLDSHQRQTEGKVYREQSHSLWSGLSAAFPDEMFLRNRVQGVRDNLHK